MLQLDVDSTLNQTYAILINMTYQGGYHHLLFIHSYDSDP